MVVVRKDFIQMAIIMAFMVVDHKDSIPNKHITQKTKFTGYG